jgi:ABC-type branched-subunit amino acid transport system permease subunit
MGLNILLGLSGQMSLGHAGFYALGAYGSALASVKLGLPVLASLRRAWASVSRPASWSASSPCVPGGLYLAMTTMTFGFLIDIAAQRWVGLTGGTMGLMGIPGIDFGRPRDGAKGFLLVAVLCLVLVQILSDFVSQSSIGRKLRALRESEAFAASVGVRVPHWRAWAFALCSATRAWPVVLFAHQSGFISSDAFSVRLSVALLIASVIGGLGARSGPLLGTAILLLIVETIAGVEKYGLIIYGAILLACRWRFRRAWQVCCPGFGRVVTTQMPPRRPQSTPAEAPRCRSSGWRACRSPSSR